MRAGRPDVRGVAEGRMSGLIAGCPGQSGSATGALDSRGRISGLEPGCPGRPERPDVRAASRMSGPWGLILLPPLLLFTRGLGDLSDFSCIFGRWYLIMHS